MKVLNYVNKSLRMEAICHMWKRPFHKKDQELLQLLHLLKGFRNVSLQVQKDQEAHLQGNLETYLNM